MSVQLTIETKDKVRI